MDTYYQFGTRNHIGVLEENNIVDFLFPQTRKSKCYLGRSNKKIGSAMRFTLAIYCLGKGRA